MRPSLRSTAIAPLAAAVLFSACSSSSTSPSGASSAATDAGADAGNLVTASFHMEETVAAGQEIFDCQFVALPDVQAFMIKGQHQYTPGSHHLLMYTTDLTSIPAGQSGVQSCYEGTGGANNVMGHVRGVLYAGQVPMGSEPLPPGIGLETSPSQVLLFQVHYLNATASSLDVKVDVQLTLDTGNDIVQKAGIFFFYDPFIDVPAGAMAKASMRCPVPDDITLLYASSHYHARGDGYGAYIDPAVDQLATKPFYTSSSWSSPPNQQMSMPIKGGSRLRFECDYDNSAGTAGYFQGPSAQTNEMCMFIGITTRRCPRWRTTAPRARTCTAAARPRAARRCRACRPAARSPSARSTPPRRRANRRAWWTAARPRPARSCPAVVREEQLRHPVRQRRQRGVHQLHRVVVRVPGVGLPGADLPVTLSPGCWARCRPRTP